jgi:cytochrome c biogenesis protein CcdA/thiol-disulfide isomerase/thioredoxin
VFLLLGFSFMAGLATVLAPCVWPILPVVLSSSAKEGKLRPFGVALGIIVSFASLTLALSYLVRAFGIDPNIFRNIAVVVLFILGMSFIIPRITALIEVGVSRLTSSFSSKLTSSSGLAGGLMTGLSLGVVWTPCAGPILATIATLAGTGQVNAIVVAMTVAYSIGAGIPLFVLASSGQRIISHTPALSRFTPLLQKIFGILIILTAIAIYFGYDKVLSSKLLDAFPSLSSFSNSFETNQAVTGELNNLQGKDSSLSENSKAPDFVGVSSWINSKPLSISSLHGKVVLVDFWTYTCINCIRTLSHLANWYGQYQSSGLVIVGVHTPEFEFEKDPSNVSNAIKQFGIKYPVAQDNDYATWNAYHNQYWPAEYLIDTNGNLRKTHFGEGDYNEMESSIRELLKETGHNFSANIANIPDQTPTDQISQETYLGSLRSEFYYPYHSPPGGNNASFSLSNNVPLGEFSLGGVWNVKEDYLEAVSGSILNLNFQARKVYLVMRPPAGRIGTVKVILDGKNLTGSEAGVDVKNGQVTVDSDRLYNLFDHSGSAVNHTLELQFQTPGIQPFVFTFG